MYTLLYTFLKVVVHYKYINGGLEMNKIIDIFENLITFKDEYEWLDFKENWFSKDEIGEYISALSNGAALCGKKKL